MGKWGKYLKHYNSKWESETELKGWLTPSSENDVANGKPEAYCKLCNCHIRAHHTDLIKHSKRTKHMDKAKSLNRSEQKSLHNYNIVIKDDTKIIEIKLSVFIAMHCAIRSVDHLGEFLKIAGKGSHLEDIKLHRTKCSMIISNVIAPVQLQELLTDISESPYALIVDESTDVSSTKFMGLCVRYFSLKYKKMVTDFLSIVKVISCTGANLAEALKNYLSSIGLPLSQLHSIGTDGASSMCKTFYSHLKESLPNLQLVKCVCHSIDLCAKYAYKTVPSHLDFILTETYNWFSHSSKRHGEYAEFFKERNNGKEPAKLQSLSKTRWLVWLPVSSVVVDQWNDLRDFFTKAAASDVKDSKVASLSNFYKDNSNLLYLTFLRSILKEVNAMNLAFEHTNVDITKLYCDLRNLVFSVAKRVLKERAVADTYRPGILRGDEVQMLKTALNDSNNLKPIDQVNFGENFTQLCRKFEFSQNTLTTVKMDCGNYLFTLCRQLLDRMPDNIGVIENIKHLTPQLTLAKIGRPAFYQLPLDLYPNADRELLESQWQSLGVFPLREICLQLEENVNINNIDIYYFWSCVLDCSNSIGEKPFKELALFALRCLTLPISNAVVERVFSFMNTIKNKNRNKLQLQMLESLLRLRVHLKVLNKCCKNFEVTKDMLTKFNSSMYQSGNNNEEAQTQNQEVELEIEDYNNLMELFENNFDQCASVASLF